MRKKFSLIIASFLSILVQAQMPDTDIWLFKIQADKENKLTVKGGKNITERVGYDNQPTFSNDGKRIYYSSVREDKQADIFYYDLKTKKNVRLTTSITESEFSPIDTDNGKFISTVTVEADSAQRIHFMNTFSGNYDRKYELDSIGYYSFLNKDTLVYYKLTKPHSLYFYVLSTGEDKWLVNNPIRGFKTINPHLLLFGIKDSLKVTFYKFNFHLSKAIKYCEFPSNNEDILWHKSLGLLKSEGVKIYQYHEPTRQWRILFDLSSYGLKKITRFEFDKDDEMLLLVDNATL